MRGDSVADAGCVRVLPRLCDKVRIDVERMHVTPRADPARDLDGGVAGAAAELGNDMSRANVGRLIESR